MIDVKHILYATDFSPTSEAALPYACQLARVFGASLHVIHVIEDPGAWRWSGDAAYAVDLSELAGAWQHDATARLAQLAQQTGLTPVTVWRMGQPAEKILEYAQEEAIDLIVVGSHGSGALAQLLLGSVAERLIRHAACPVLTVKAPQAQQSAEWNTSHDGG